MGKTKKRGGKNEKTDQERQQNTQKRPKNDENLKKVVCSIRKVILDQWSVDRSNHGPQPKILKNIPPKRYNCWAYLNQGSVGWPKTSPWILEDQSSSSLPPSVSRQVFLRGPFRDKIHQQIPCSQSIQGGVTAPGRLDPSHRSLIRMTISGNRLKVILNCQ